MNVYALHLDLPAGATEVTAEFQYLSPTATAQGRVVMTPDMLNLQWNLVAFYPAGWFTRQIPVDATAILPAGLALRHRAGAARSGARPGPCVQDDQLRRSGRFADVRRALFPPGAARARRAALNIVADTPEELAATPEQIEAHRELVLQAVKLFGSQHYDHYDFLLAISDRQGGIGLEHHRSSENGVAPGYFTKWDDNAGRHNLLPHEFTHSWNGKYRRGADLFTPDFPTPMRNCLLWVYEGQTQFWGYVLQARSGFVPKEDTLAAYAMIAALHENRPGRLWRPLVDTTNDPIMSARRPQPWLSWQRSEDYYNEGLLDLARCRRQLREMTGGRKSLDDFARAFFGPGDRDWGVSPTMSRSGGDAERHRPVRLGRLPGSTRRRSRRRRRSAGWRRSGYRLAYTRRADRLLEVRGGGAQDHRSQLFARAGPRRRSAVTQVIWDSPAFAAGITAGATLLAVDGRAYDADDAENRDHATPRPRAQPIALLVKKQDRFVTARIAYAGGLLISAARRRPADRRRRARSAAGEAVGPLAATLAFSPLSAKAAASKKAGGAYRMGRRQRSAYGRT